MLLALSLATVMAVHDGDTFYTDTHVAGWCLEHSFTVY